MASLGHNVLSPVIATHLKIGHPQISSAGAQSPYELQWLDLKIGHQDSSPHNNHQGDMLYLEEQTCLKTTRSGQYVPASMCIYSS